ncbi:MAG: hypothetical protein ACRC33_28065 [Gemmataceae bacterium]
MPWRVEAPNTLFGLTDGTFATIFPGGAADPRFFLSGDGHRHPPFRWLLSCSLVQNHFTGLMNLQKLFAHVEELQSDVTADSVPAPFSALHAQNRIFGWEPAIYAHLGAAMQECLALADTTLDPAVMGRRAVALDHRMAQAHALRASIGDPDDLRLLRPQAIAFREYYEGTTRMFFKKDREPAVEEKYLKFLFAYNKVGMKLRIDVNRYIGENIREVISANPDATHIITVGDAHIAEDPVQNYIALPKGVDGIVDPGK